MKPMRPNASVASTAVQTYGLRRSAQRSVAVTAAPRISNPPMVGVPSFAWWLCGPSPRITWPI